MPEDILSLVYLAKEVAEERGAQAYLVGGFVRDLILRRRNYDLDITVIGSGIEFAEVFCRRAGGRLVIHRRFGTATVSLPNGHKVDFATARKECYPHPAALPEVSPGSLEDDLFRRDFTMNTLAIGLGKGCRDTLIDLYHGREDIRAGIVRVLHPLSFMDDPTRVLRCVRFEQRFGFSVERRTLGQLKDAVRQGLLSRVNPHRLRDEIILMLKEEKPARCLRRLKELAGFDFISPGAVFTRRTERDFRRVRESADWYRERFPGRVNCELWLAYLMLFLEPLGYERAKSVCRAFAFARNDSKRVLEYIQAFPAAAAALSRRSPVRPSGLFRVLSPLSAEGIVLLRAKAPAAGRHIEDFLGAYHAVRCSLSGHDLKALGVAPGPEYQRILRGLLDAKLDGAVCTREEEIKAVSKMIKERGAHAKKR